MDSIFTYFYTPKETALLTVCEAVASHCVEPWGDTQTTPPGTQHALEQQCLFVLLFSSSQLSACLPMTHAHGLAEQQATARTGTEGAKSCVSHTAWDHGEQAMAAAPTLHSTEFFRLGFWSGGWRENAPRLHLFWSEKVFWSLTVVLLSMNCLQQPGSMVVKSRPSFLKFTWEQKCSSRAVRTARSLVSTARFCGPQW